MEEVKSLYGLATVFPESLANPWKLGAAMVMWIIAPLAFASWRFK
jgi:Cu-processing system permease protein